MQTYNFFANQFVGVNDLMEVQSVPQAAIKDILVSLQDKGVVAGFGVTPTGPVSPAVVVAAGHILLEDGSDVTTTAPTTVPIVGSPSLTAGQSVIATLYAIPLQQSDTPVVTPAGLTINYRTFDSVQYALVWGTPTTGTPVSSIATPTGFTGVRLADVTMSYGTSSVSSGQINTTQALVFVTIPYLLSLINGFDSPPFTISQITGLAAALAALSPSGSDIPESQVIGLVSDLNTLTTALAALTATVSTDVTGIDATLATHGTEIATLNTEVATNSTNIASNTSGISTLNSEVAANSATLTTMAAELAAIALAPTFSSPSRALGVTYQNTTGKALFVKVSGYLNIGGSVGQTGTLQATLGSSYPSVAVDTASVVNGAGFCSVSMIVPANYYYRVNTGGIGSGDTGALPLNSWVEYSLAIVT